MASVTKRRIRTGELMAPIAHFSHALRIGDEIHLGATAGTDRARRLAGSLPGVADASAQADRMYANMKLALRLLGGTMKDVVRLKVYLADWRDEERHERCCAAHFDGRRPAFSMVGSWGFPLPLAVVEAELTAVVGGATPFRYGSLRGADPRQALASLAQTLRDADLRMSDVVHVNVTLSDLRDYPALDEAFSAAFPAPCPARSVSIAPLSGWGMRVALDTVAVRGGGEAVEPAGLFRMPGAASSAIRTGAHLFISAQPGIDAHGAFADTIAAQTRAAWRRIEAILHKAGMDAGNVIRTNNWLTDWRCYEGFNSAFGEFVAAPYPPRATVAAGLVGRSALVEIEALAHAHASDATVLETHAEEES